MPELLDRHGEERDGLLLARRDQHVVLARLGVLATELLGERHQRVGLPRHRGDHDRDGVPRRGRGGHPAGDVPDALRIPDAGAAELLDDQAHGGAGVSREPSSRARPHSDQRARAAASVPDTSQQRILAFMTHLHFAC